jgi:hypothetical protein
MARGVRMKVTTQIAGNHDPRVLVGSDPGSGFSWGGGEEIVVTPELAVNYESSGIARRLEEKPESAAVATPEVAAFSAPKKRQAPKPDIPPESHDTPESN